MMEVDLSDVWINLVMNAAISCSSYFIGTFSPTDRPAVTTAAAAAAVDSLNFSLFSPFHSFFLFAFSFVPLDFCFSLR